MSRDLNDTLIFARVVELGSFTAAARALGLPKATISRRVAALEKRLGTPLLHRTTRKLGLSEAGAVYYEHASHIARDLDEAEQAVHQLNGGPRGWLRVTAPMSIGLNSLASLLVEFRARYPDLHVEMLLSNERLDLIAEEIDVALRVGALPDSNLAARRLATFHGKVFASPRYLVRNGEPLGPEDLVHHRALALPNQRRHGGFAFALADGSTEAEFPVVPVLVANDPFALKPALLAGEGLMLTSEAVVRDELAAGLVRPVLAGWTGRAMELNAVFPRGRTVTPKVRVFVDFLIERLNFDTPKVARATAADIGYCEPATTA